MKKKKSSKKPSPSDMKDFLTNFREINDLFLVNQTEDESAFEIPRTVVLENKKKIGIADHVHESLQVASKIYENFSTTKWNGQTKQRLMKIMEPLIHLVYQCFDNMELTSQEKMMMVEIMASSGIEYDLYVLVGSSVETKTLFTTDLSTHTYLLEIITTIPIQMMLVLCV
jgi:hypothetical protein